MSVRKFVDLIALDHGVVSNSVRELINDVLIEMIKLTSQSYGRANVYTFIDVLITQHISQSITEISSSDSREISHLKKIRAIIRDYEHVYLCSNVNYGVWTTKTKDDIHEMLTLLAKALSEHTELEKTKFDEIPQMMIRLLAYVEDIVRDWIYSTSTDYIDHAFSTLSEFAKKYLNEKNRYSTINILNAIENAVYYNTITQPKGKSAEEVYSELKNKFSVDEIVLALLRDRYKGIDLKQ